MFLNIDNSMLILQRKLSNNISDNYNSNWLLYVDADMAPQWFPGSDLKENNSLRACQKTNLNFFLLLATNTTVAFDSCSVIITDKVKVLTSVTDNVIYVGNDLS